MNFQEISKKNAIRLAGLFLVNPQQVTGFTKEHYSQEIESTFIYEQTWSPLDLDLCGYYEMVGLSESKTPRYRERSYPCGHIFKGQTHNPELWCFYPDFEEALATLISEEETRCKYESPLLVPFWAKAA
jgi:hypothetical protein